MNPIENLWYELKEFLRREVKPRTKEELVAGIHQFWETVTTEALEIKGAANSVCLRRIVALCGSGVYGCGLGVYGVRFRNVWVSPRILWYKPVTLHLCCDQ